MNTSYNHHLCTLTLLGNLVGKPEVRYQANPVVAIAEIKIATHSRWYDKTTKQFKEWTSFHTVKVIGDIVDETLVHANKGDVVLVHGYLLNSRKTGREIIHATFAQTFAKGYAQSINQIQCSGEIDSEIQLVTTQKDKILAEFSLAINHQVYSPVSQTTHNFKLNRLIHVWGRQAQYIKEHAQEKTPVVIEGKINYLNNANKNQYIDVEQIVILKHH